MRFLRTRPRSWREPLKLNLLTLGERGAACVNVLSPGSKRNVIDSSGGALVSCQRFKKPCQKPKASAASYRASNYRSCRNQQDYRNPQSPCGGQKTVLRVNSDTRHTWAIDDQKPRKRSNIHATFSTTDAEMSWLHQTKRSVDPKAPSQRRVDGFAVADPCETETSKGGLAGEITLSVVGCLEDHRKWP